MVLPAIYIESQSLASQGHRRVYLEATVVHFLEETEGATRLVMAVRVVALDDDLFGVEFDVAATGAVELSSSDGAYGCRGRGAHCD